MDLRRLLSRGDRKAAVGAAIAFSVGAVGMIIGLIGGDTESTAVRVLWVGIVVVLLTISAVLLFFSVYMRR